VDGEASAVMVAVRPAAIAFRMSVNPGDKIPTESVG
jgi:hypothetical protein